MTMPDERTRAVIKAKHFMRFILNRQRSPGLPKWLRELAYRVLKHHPSVYDLEDASKKCPERFGKVDEEAMDLDFDYFGNVHPPEKKKRVKKK